MTKELMDDVGLRCIQRHTVMANVLSRVEDFEGKAVQELSLSQETAHRLQPPASLALQEL